MRCPHCGSVVEPWRDPQGSLVCPLCRNTGRVQAPPTAWAPLDAPAPPVPPYAITQPGAIPPLAVVSLVLGLVGLFLITTLVLAPAAVILGAVAVGLGIPALRKDRQPPVSGAGRGLAIGGIVAGALAFAAGVAAVFLAFTFFSLVDDLEDPSATPDLSFSRDPTGPGGVLTVVSVDPDVAWEDLSVEGTAACSPPSGPVEPGDRVFCEVDGSVQVYHLPSYTLLYESQV